VKRFPGGHLLWREIETAVYAVIRTLPKQCSDAEDAPGNKKRAKVMKPWLSFSVLTSKIKDVRALPLCVTSTL